MVGEALVEFLDEGLFLLPQALLLVGPLVEGDVGIELLEKLVGRQHAVAAGSEAFELGVAGLGLAFGHATQFHKQQEERLVEVVGLLEAEVEFLERHLCGLAFVLVVSIDELYHFQTDECTIDHSCRNVRPHRDIFCHKNTTFYRLPKKKTSKFVFFL